jgi:hypothetical protein
MGDAGSPGRRNCVFQIAYWLSAFPSDIRLFCLNVS